VIQEDLLPPSKVIPVDGGDTINFGPKGNTSLYRVTVVKCIHQVPCVGYCFDQKLSKLKDEYKGTSGRDLGELRKKGIQVSEEIFKPLFVYLGDTHYTVFEQNPELFNYPVIIVECTFIDSETLDRANREGHIHWSQLEPIVLAHPNITFVLIHFSCRYNEQQVHEFFDNLATREENPLSLANVVLFIGNMSEGRNENVVMLLLRHMFVIIKVS
jgi:ribonuclease Z